MRCSSPGDTVAGGTSIPNQVAGIIRDAAGAPVRGAKVKLVDILSPETLLPVVADSTQTGSLGDYQFENVSEGTYAIEASLDSSMVLYRESIDVGFHDTVDVSGTLVTGGTITGAVTLPGSFDCLLHIANSHHTIVPDASGTFTVTGLQPGVHILLTIVKNAATGSSAIVRSDSVVVAGGVATDVGTLETQPLHHEIGLVVVDDFEDGDNVTFQGQYWWLFDDRYDGGTSQVVPFHSDSMVTQSGNTAGTFSAHCTFVFGDVSGPHHLGMGFVFGSPYRDIPQAYDLSGLRKIHFRAKGSGCNLSAEVRTELFSYAGSGSVRATPVTAEWAEHVIDIASLLAIDSIAAQGIPFCDQFIILATGEPRQSGELWVDDVTFEY